MKISFFLHNKQKERNLHKERKTLALFLTPSQAQAFKSWACAQSLTLAKVAQAQHARVLRMPNVERSASETKSAGEARVQSRHPTQPRPFGVSQLGGSFECPKGIENNCVFLLFWFVFSSCIATKKRK